MNAVEFACRVNGLALKPCSQRSAINDWRQSLISSENLGLIPPILHACIIHSPIRIHSSKNNKRSSKTRLHVELHSIQLQYRIQAFISIPM